MKMAKNGQSSNSDALFSPVFDSMGGPVCPFVGRLAYLYCYCIVTFDLVGHLIFIHSGIWTVDRLVGRSTGQVVRHTSWLVCFYLPSRIECGIINGAFPANKLFCDEDALQVTSCPSVSKPVEIQLSLFSRLSAFLV